MALYCLLGVAAGELPGATAGRVWRPDPAVVGRLTSPERVGEYRFSLPAGYTRSPVPAGLPANVSAAVFVRAGSEVSLTVTRTTAVKLAAAGRANPGRFVSDFLDGVTDTAPLIITRRQKPDTRALDGRPVTRVAWAGKTTDGDAVAGVTYAAFDGPTVVVFLIARVGPAGAVDAADLESAVATLHKK